MKKPDRTYDIKLSAMEDGVHRFRYHLNQAFFDRFDYDEFDKADIDVHVVAEKSGHLINFHLHSEGQVELPDDLTGKPYMQSVDGRLSFVVKFGEEYNDDNDELIILPYQTPFYNLAQAIYEMVVLSVPMKHVAPDRELTEPEEEPEKRIDPRWEVLKKLLDNDKNE